MPMRVANTPTMKVYIGSSRVSAVWKDGALLYPSGLVRNNFASTAYWNRDNIVQFSLSQPGAQLGSSSQLSTGWCPANYGGLRGYYCKVTGSYSYRYAAYLTARVYPGITAEIGIYRLNLNPNTGVYDTSTVIASHTLQTMVPGSSYSIDVGEGRSVYLAAGNWYAFGYSSNSVGQFSESYALSSLCANF